MPRRSAASRTSARVSVRSARASATVPQIPVMISIVHSKSSCLAFGCSPFGMALAELVEDVRRGADQLAGLAVDQLQLDLDAQASARAIR